jgi:hypothetical protein
MKMRRTPLPVRRTIDIPARWLAGGGRTVSYLATGVVAGQVVAANLSSLVPSLFYDIAFLAAAAGTAHNLARWRALERTAWNLGDGGRSAVLLAATGLEIAFLILLAGICARLSGSALPASSLWGLLHLAAIALFLSRLPLRPSAVVYALLATIWVVPALIPVWQPMLDVRRWFHPGGFPGWIGAVSPILALVLGALALPARALSSSGTNPA